MTGVALAGIYPPGMKLVADRVGWQWAFLPLVLGPAVGTLAMWRLRRLPESSALADGNR